MRKFPAVCLSSKWTKDIFLSDEQHKTILEIFTCEKKRNYHARDLVQSTGAFGIQESGSIPSCAWSVDTELVTDSRPHEV